MGEFQVKLQREHQNFNYWVKNGHQRVPCTLMPWRKQVAPTALHSSSNTSPSKPSSRCGLDHSTPPFSNAWNLLEWLQLPGNLPWPFQCSCSFCRGPALQGEAPPHPQGRAQQEKSRDADAATGRCSPCQTGCLFLLGLAGGAWMLLHNSTSTPQISCIPKKARDRHIHGAICSFAQHTARVRRTAAAQAVAQAAAGRAVPGSACQPWVSWTLLMGQSCCLLPPRGLLTFHLD